MTCTSPQEHTCRCKAFSTKNQKICPSHIRAWQKLENELAQKVRTTSAAETVHSGTSINHCDFEQKVYDWITTQRVFEVAISPGSIIAKMSAIDSTFKNGDKTIVHCVYFFVTRWRISCRVATYTGQKLTVHVLYARKKFLYQLMKRFSSNGTYRKVVPSKSVDMGETAVYFKVKRRCAVHRTAACTISLISSGSTDRWLTFAYL